MAAQDADDEVPEGEEQDLEESQPAASAPQTEVVDDAAGDTSVVPPVSYEITSYGADPDVDVLVKRLDRGDIIVPEFQRSFVWPLRESSRFVESLLLGLPVPGVFFAQEADSKRMLVIDGQQRLKTLQFFKHGVFNPKKGDKRQRVFALDNVQERLLGKTYKDLEEPDRRRLDNAVIHATIVKQDSPVGDDTSVFHIFERLNSGGRRLTDQEMRCALFHGPFIEAVKSMNDSEPWRRVFGLKNARLKDQELILRFLALLRDFDLYKRPMGEFITKFVRRHKDGPSEFIAACTNDFLQAIGIVADALDRLAFRPERSLNAAVFDAVMIGLARRLQSGRPLEATSFRGAYEQLIKDADFVEATSQSTADEKMVLKRVSAATTAFSVL